VVFQHAGDWTIKEYAKSAVYPRGSVVGQVRCFSLRFGTGRVLKLLLPMPITFVRM